MSSTPSTLVEKLRLQPHPEGGHYREVYRSLSRVSGGEGGRASLTTIYFLLAAQEHSRWHRLDADEVWHFYEGHNLELLHYDPASKTLQRVILGSNLEEAAVLVHVVPEGHWQAARSLGDYSLVGCTMGPGFEFSGFSFVADLPLHKNHFTARLAPFQELL